MSCAESVVASVCSVCTFLSSSLVYLIFLSLALAADCLFARILHTEDHRGSRNYTSLRSTTRNSTRDKDTDLETRT